MHVGLFRAGVVEHLFGDIWKCIARFAWGISCDTLLVVCSVKSRPTESGVSSSEFGISEVTVIDKCGQATKGVWWMPWQREATKDVVACDKLREAGKQASIRRFLNAETRSRVIEIILR